MKTHVVIGANRGIGLGLVEKLREQGQRIIATCRTDQGGLRKLDGVEVIDGVDITDQHSLHALADQLPEFDVLWVVAGVLKRTTLDSVDPQVCQQLFEVNALGPLMTVSALKGHIRSGGKIALITSRMGSINDNTSGGSYGYRMSKSALNSAGKSMALDLLADQIAVFMLHPGWVRTDMTQGRGLVDVHESVQGLMERVQTLTIENTGTFWHMQGDPLPW
ncbi:MAG: short-chain dehydrogenase [Myxococcales bacterium]|nr:short-chain dehydrogenase [Myxococcales bacterium]